MLDFERIVCSKAEHIGVKKADYLLLANKIVINLNAYELNSDVTHQAELCNFSSAAWFGFYKMRSRKSLTCSGQPQKN